MEGIQSNNARFSQAVQAGDAAAVTGCYTPDATLMPPGAPAMRGADAIEAFWRIGIESGLRSVELRTGSLEVFGDTAVEVGAATVRIEPAGAPPLIDVGKYVVVHERQADGSWKWAVDIFNSDAAAPVPDETVSVAQTTSP